MFTAKNRLICLLLFAVLLVLDQATKHWALDTYFLRQSQEILPFLKFTLAFNEGIGLSMFAFLSDIIDEFSQLLFGMINVVISILIMWFFRNETRLIPVIGWTTVLAGALGNAVDRFVALFTWRTGVVDFIHVHWQNTYHFPVFNIADCAITLGFVLILLDIIILDRQQSNPQQPTD